MIYDRLYKGCWALKEGCRTQGCSVEKTSRCWQMLHNFWWEFNCTASDDSIFIWTITDLYFRRARKKVTRRIRQGPQFNWHHKMLTFLKGRSPRLVFLYSTGIKKHICQTFLTGRPPGLVFLNSHGIEFFWQTFNRKITWTGVPLAWSSLKQAGWPVS